jgi:hypothetical protein
MWSVLPNAATTLRDAGAIGKMINVAGQRTRQSVLVRSKAVRHTQ